MLAFFAASAILAPAPQLPPLPQIRRQPQVTYVDRSGALLGVRGGRYGPPVDMTKLPAHVAAAFVAIEDRRFYSHNGVDPMGIGRAIVANLTEGRAAQGASTITQQLAKNLFLSSDQTLERKANEAVLAFQLEQKFSKRQILGLYLSRVYFGSGAYGIEAAAQRYFNKPAARLTVREAAILAGILKSPTNYNPLEKPEASAQRTRLVLDAMVETGALSPGDRAKALSATPRIWTSAPTAPAQYFVDWLSGQQRRLPSAPGQDMVVETTLDSAMETAAAEAARNTVARYQKQKASQAALVAMDGQGRVRAMIGGVDYRASPYNRATEARRQAGSAWKPFVYLTALEAGRVPDMVVVDEPVTIAGWTPRNYNPGYLGPITLQQAVAQSVNTVAARLADEVGRQNVAATARRLGIGSPINTDPAMALGTTLVSPLEMAQAYAVLSNGGAHVAAYGIERIRTTGGKVIYQHKPPSAAAAVANPPLSDLNLMLRTVIAQGTGQRAAISGYDLAGKTGTTSDYKDAWFAGYSGNFAAVVWMGRDDAAPMGRITGGGAPAELWRWFMASALKRSPARNIPAGPPPPAPPPPLAVTETPPLPGPVTP